MINRVSAAQKRKAFINSFNTLLHSVIATSLAYRIKLARSIFYLEFLSLLRPTFIPSAGISFSNASFYVSSYITSR